MTRYDLHQLIQEAVREVICETSVDLESLHDGISTSTITGKQWFKMVNEIASLINEVNEFKSQYASQRHGPLPNMDGAMINLNKIVQLLELVKPVIIGMDAIERKDMSENHLHGRYAQQAGATPFEAPGGQAIN